MSEILTIEKIVKAGTKLTPMMEQYHQIKIQHKDVLLLFRMGDFYEVFFEDAELAAKLLNITLTKRGKLGDTPIPMAGIPHHAAKNYLDKITSQGHKAAICEQIEDPKQAKGIVKRAVTQVISPGIPYDIESQNQSEAHYICSSYKNKKNEIFLSFMDFATGDFFGFSQLDEESFYKKILLYAPKEFITYPGQMDQDESFQQFINLNKILLSYCDKEFFIAKYNKALIEKYIPHHEKDKTLSKKSHDIFDCISALIGYIERNQEIINNIHIKPFRLINDKDYLNVSATTLKGLEILPRHKDQEKFSLLNFINGTKTPMGLRLLRKEALTPLNNIKSIQFRHEFIRSFLSHPEELKEIRTKLDDIRDIDRILAKVSINKATPQDLTNLSHSLISYKEIHQLMNQFDFKLKSSNTVFSEKISHLIKEINAAINDEVGVSIEKANLINPGYSKKRDQLYQLRYSAHDEFKKLELYYRKKLNITNLKIKSNNINGYYIEVSKSHIGKIGNDFKRFQTLTNSERYETTKLKNLEKEVLSADEKLLQIDRKIFTQFIDSIKDLNKELQTVSKEVSFLDLIQGFAWVAYQEELVQPEITHEKCIELEGVWHPLVKLTQKQKIVPHSIKLNNKNTLALITGPNMAGKTTVMREVAIVQFLTQLGSFVPAKKVKLSLCDFLFSRLGASDDIVHGQSTFMLEMSETSEILRHASHNSLILLDEIGRGTSTFDGLSIAWALIEYLVKELKAITLFSTHYHELIHLVESLEHAKNFTVKTVQDKDHIQFLYELIEGGAKESFGINVAKLAGLPDSIINRSKEILKSFEDEKEIELTNEIPPIDQSNDKNQQLSFFESQKDMQVPDHLYRLEKEIDELDILNMTPINALKKLDELKNHILH